MSEFKAGDTVRRVKYGCQWAPLGYETVLHEGDDEKLWYIDAQGDGTTFVEWQWELVNSPIRTETTTRTVIEPGVYGRLWVKPTSGPHVHVKLVTIHGTEITEAALDSTELRELAHIATELADGLDAQ